MADNYLITGYHGEPHVTAENDRGIHAGIFGKGRFVLPVGEQFNAEYVGNNIVRMYDGKLIDNGAAAGIPAGRYIEMLIPAAGQGMNRNDLIIFQYTRDASTLIESGTFHLLQGEETSGTASDPELTQEDLLTDNADIDQFALWRVSVSGSAVAAPVQLFELTKTIPDLSENEDGDFLKASDIADNLTTNDSQKPLSAKQGVELKALIDGFSTETWTFTLEDDTTVTKQVVVKV